MKIRINGPAPFVTRRVTTAPLEASPVKPRDGLQAAYERAVRRFGNIPGVQIQVCTSSGSDHKPVVALRHQQGNQENVRVQVHFHGDQLYDTEVDYEGQIGPCVERAWNKEKDTVFVLPEAANENAAPRSDWNNVSNIGQIAKDAVVSLGLDPIKVGYRTVSGHSAGGSVVAKALARSTSQQGMAAVDRIELYDAAVGSQHNPVSDSERQRVQRWCQQNLAQFLVVPGVMQSSWLTYVDSSRWTERAKDHWSPLWQSLGQSRQPAAELFVPACSPCR